VMPTPSRRSIVDGRWPDQGRPGLAAYAARLRGGAFVPFLAGVAFLAWVVLAGACLTWVVLAGASFAAALVAGALVAGALVAGALVAFSAGRPAADRAVARPLFAASTLARRTSIRSTTLVASGAFSATTTSAPFFLASMSSLTRSV